MVRELPTGVYRVGAVIDADPRNDLGVHDRGLPGDLRGEGGRVVLRVDGDAPSVDVELGRLIRLLEPEDTIRGLPRAGKGAPPRLSSPVPFAWDAVPGADRYTVSLEVERGGRVVPETTSLVREPRWTVKLPVTRDDEVGSL